MFKIKLIISIISFMLLQKNLIIAQKLDVLVLYESLCSDSIKFITQQLYPVWNEVAPFLNIKFVPFGKSSSIGNGESFICQHGPKECLGNRIQSCVLDLLKDSNAHVEYVNCFMNIYKNNRNNENELGQSCAANVGINWTNINQCQKSQLGTMLQLQAEAVTNEIAPKFIPTILYNGQFNQQAQDESQTNFLGVICQFLKGVSIPACNSPIILPI